jgi:hypothetical protein
VLQGRGYNPLRLALKKSSPRLLILNEKDIRVKIKKHIIVRCNSMDRGKTFRGLWDVENIV